MNATAFGILVVAALLAAALAYRAFIGPFSSMLGGAEAARAKAAAVRRMRAGRRADVLHGVGGVMESIAPSLPEREDAQRDKLAAAGLSLTPQGFRAVSAIAMAALALAGAGIATALELGPSPALGGAVAGAALGWLGAQATLATLAGRRRREIERTLPAAIDLMSIMIGAGLPLERAFKEIADSADSLGEAAREFAVVDREVNRASVDFCDAMAAMSRRCASPDVSSFCSALIQSRRQGSGIKPVLESQAVYARKAHFDAIKRRINKLEVWISIPLGMCFLPAMILLAMAPIVWQIIEQLPGLM